MLGTVSFLFVTLLAIPVTNVDVFEDMNNDFLDHYEANANTNADNLDQNPLFIMGSGLNFLYGSTNETINITTPTFVLLKDACHAVVAVYVILQFERDKKISSETKNNLTLHSNRVSACIDNIMQGNQDHYLTTQQKDDSLKMMKDVVIFIDRVLKDGIVHSNDLLAFCRSQTSTIESFVYDSTQSLATFLINTVKTWKSKLTDTEWINSKVIVQTAKAPRRNQFALQIFLAIFNNSREGFNVYQLTELDGTLPLSLQKYQVGRFMNDVALGNTFFSNPQSMLSDLLGNATEIIVKTLRSESVLPLQPTPEFPQMWATTGPKCPYH